MSESENDKKIYSVEDIRRYLGGKMTREEMHFIEKASLEDPFLADAIEGYKNINETESGASIKTLYERLQNKANQKIVPLERSRKWWRIAAAAIVILGAGLASYFLINTPAENTSIAQRGSASAKDSGASQRQRFADSTITSPPVATQTEKTAASDIKVEKEDKAIVKKKESSERVLVEEPANAFTEAEKNDTKAKSKPAEGKDTDLAGKAPEPKIDQPKAEESVARKLPSVADDKSAISPAKAINANYFRGKVVDANNRSIPFANINIKGTNSSSYTDVKGNFNVMAADSQLSVEIKSVGYLNKNFTLSADSTSNRVIMQSGPDNLREVAATTNAPRSRKAQNKKAEPAIAGAEEAVPEAEPIDGWGLYQLYLLNNVRIPFDARQKNLKGIVLLSFLVHEKGDLSDFRIEKSLCPNCDKESIRLVKEGPKWELNYGKKAARVYVSVVF